MYLMRLDDAAEYWDKEKWNRMHEILSKYNVRPIFAIIPHTEDKSLLKYDKDEEFLETILSWVDEGWSPALHGYNHVLKSKNSGINPINEYSEFAGVPYEDQKNKISNGYQILRQWGIKPQIFVAPGHTFDCNTLRALKETTDIRIISDTIATDMYYQNDFFYLPQQSGQVRNIKAKLSTFCYHPNTTTDEQFFMLENFLEKNADKFISFNDLSMIKREKSTLDKLVSSMYFLRRKLIKTLHR